jgi:glycosyltransferase involved in cell wall biosynthesis
MQKNDHQLLGVVVPLTRLAGKFDPIKSWLQEALDLKIRVIFVHDINDVNTSAELQELINRLDSELISVFENENLGPGGARNLGLTKLDTKWVAFWDADDYPVPRAVLQMVMQADQKDFKACVGGYSVYHQETKKEIVNLLPRYKFQIAINPGIWRWAFRRETIECSPFPHIYMGEDQAFIANFLNQNPDTYQFNFMVYTYITGNPNQLTTSKRNLSDLLPALEFFQKEFGTKSFQKTVFISMLKIRIIGTVCKNIGNFNKLRVIKMFLSQTNLVAKNLIANIEFARTRSIPREVVSLNLRGGFGNQLFQIATAMSFSGKSEVQINLNEISQSGQTKSIPLFNYLWPEQIEFQNISDSILRRKVENLGLRITQNKKNKGKRKSNAIKQFFQKRILETLILGKSTVLQKNPGFFEIIPRPKGSVRLIGYFQSHLFISSAVSDWFKNELKLYRSTKVSMLENQLTDTKYLVCHIRLGDYLGESSFGIVSPSKYAGIVAREWEKGKYKNIVVFSNELERIFDFLPANLKPFIKIVSEAETDLVAEFEMMRKGSGYILSNSTFGWWAAFLSKTENPNVIAPKPWFIELEDPSELIPTSWMREDYIVNKSEFSSRVPKAIIQ